VSAGKRLLCEVGRRVSFPDHTGDVRPQALFVFVDGGSEGLLFHHRFSLAGKTKRLPLVVRKNYGNELLVEDDYAVSIRRTLLLSFREYLRVDTL
jgi:hypothetical protein